MSEVNRLAMLGSEQVRVFKFTDLSRLESANAFASAGPVHMEPLTDAELAVVVAYRNSFELGRRAAEAEEWQQTLQLVDGLIVLYARREELSVDNLRGHLRLSFDSLAGFDWDRFEKATAIFNLLHVS